MAKPKTDPVPYIERLMEQARELEIKQPIEKTRWFVAEVSNARFDDEGRYDEGRFVRASPFFVTEELAQAWKDKHDPDEGYDELIVKRQNLRTMTTRMWVNY